MQDFDFLGLILLVGGVVCLLIGFNHSETSCKFVLRDAQGGSINYRQYHRV